MRKFSATYIIPGNQPPLKYGILICENDGTIIDLIDTGGVLKEQAGLEYHSGIIIPGLINAHCHLELSHLKGLIPPHTGLAVFLGYIHNLRNAAPETIESAVRKAEFQMEAAGIRALGDVSNSLLTLEIKQKSKLYYHTFAEAFGFHPSRAEKAYQLAVTVQELFTQSGLQASVSPHSAFSVSEELFLKISDKVKAGKSIISVHNQESREEDLFFRESSGPLANHFENNLLIDISKWNPSLKNSLEYLLHHIPAPNQLLLVHNTYTTENDINILKTLRDPANTFLVLCPNSNLYIESQLPPVMLFRQENMNICIGTDSLASNSSLSVLQEMITLQENFPGLKLHELVTWGCLNGARALQIDNLYGSFETGKKPGINLITGADLQKLKLTPASRIKVLQ